MKIRLFNPCRRWRLFYCLIGLLLAVSLNAKAQTSTTLVQDVVYRGDGTPASGTLVISWPAFTTANSLSVAAGSMSVAIGAQGAISIALVPNAGGTPDGTYYKVIYKLSDGATSEEYWSVPATTTTTIAAIRSKIVPSGVAMQVASRQYVDSSIAAALAGFHGPFPLVVTSFQGRTGDVVAAANDYSYSQLKNIPTSFNAGQLLGRNLDAPTAAGQQVTFNGTRFIEQPKLAADFRDFGAIGNTVTDDTNAANVALSALASNGGGFQIPGASNSFWMKLSSPLALNNTGNFLVRGAGDSGGFAYCGNGAGPVVNASNAYDLGLRDFAIYGHWQNNCTTTYATAGILWDKTGSSGWNSTGLMLNRLTINGAPQGDISTPNFTCVDISPTSQVNVEDGKFYNINCNPGGGTGFHIGASPNAKNEIFFNNNVGFGQYGYRFDSGSYHIKYGEVGNLSQSALMLSAASDPVSVEGLLSEANRQFLQLGANFGPPPITLSHINNGWDSQATAPCFWDLGGAQYVLAFSNTWSDTSVATPHALCGNSSSSGMFLNNSFAWKVGGASGGLYEMLPPPADIQQLLGPSYGFFGGGNMVVGSVNPNTNNGLSFIQSTSATRQGLRVLENSSLRMDGALPVANDDPYLGDGVLEVAGPGAPTVLPGCTVTGGDTSTTYTFWMFAKDASGNRTTESHTFCHGPATFDSNHQATFQWVGTAGSQSYDVMFMSNGSSCFIGNTTATSITVSSMPACDNSYPRPLENEAEYVKVRGKGLYGYGPASATTPTWWIDNVAGNFNTNSATSGSLQLWGSGGSSFAAVKNDGTDNVQIGDATHAVSMPGGISAPNVATLCTAASAQTCINALATTGGTVQLAAGTYTGAITLPDNGKCVNLVGAGIDLTVLTVNASASAVVSKANSSLPLNCRIADLTINGNFQATDGLRLQKGKGWQIERVKIERVSVGGEGAIFGESSGSSAEFYDARIRNVVVAFESGDYTSSARPLNGLHFLTTATDNQISDITAWNMTGAGIVDDAGDNQYSIVHVYGFPLLTYYPNYAMDVLGNTHVVQLTSDGVALGGVHVRGNGNSITHSTFQWPTGGEASGAFPIMADAGTDFNDYSNNLVRNGTNLIISQVPTIASIGGAIYPGPNTSITNNIEQGGSNYFVNFWVQGPYVAGQGTPHGAFTYSTPFTAQPTLTARRVLNQTADLFDCLEEDNATLLCLIDKNGNATFASVTAPLTGNASTATALASTPAQCSSGQYSTGIAASGNANCSQVDYSQLSGTPALGNAASKNVGTTSGTVAAGDDSRFNCDVTKNPCRMAATSLTAQTASIGNTTLYTPSSAGTYRVILALWTMATGSSGTVSFSLSANTGSGAESFGSSSLDLTKINSGGQVSGQWNIHVASSQAISYNTTLTCSSCGSPQYGIDVVVERLQ